MYMVSFCLPGLIPRKIKEFFLEFSAGYLYAKWPSWYSIMIGLRALVAVKNSML